MLDQNGSLKSVMPSQISNKIEKRRNAVATDRNGSEIRNDDTVREIGGENKRGIIVHIHRSFLFLHNREQTENSGIFVVRATNVATIAAKGGRVTQQGSTGPNLTKMNPALQRNGNANGAMAPPRSFGRDRALGQTVTIRKGPYKGLLGIVKDTTDTEARVELHTKSKTVQVAKDVLSIKDSISGNSIPYHEFAGRGRGGAGRGGFGGATPTRTSDWAGSRTPVAAASGQRTPAWGSSAPARTPAWSGGASASSKTPRWGQESTQLGNKTPAWNADGGRTSYGGAGGVSFQSSISRINTNIHSEHLPGSLEVELRMAKARILRTHSTVVPRRLRTTTQPVRPRMSVAIIPILILGLALMMLQHQPRLLLRPPPIRIRHRLLLHPRRLQNIRVTG